MALESLATLIGIIVGIVGTYLSMKTYYRNRRQEMLQEFADKERKEYAAQRDFSHLQRNYQNLQISVDQLFKEIELRVDRVESRINRLNILTRAISVKLDSGDVVKDMFDSQDDLD
ncbi:MAG: hypothetical protein ACFE0J_22230 [Elainellaceae cyanobacterium]